MTKFMFSALCAAAMVTSVSAQGGKDMLSNGIKYLDVPYVAHTLEADGPEELVINCDEVDCTSRKALSPITCKKSVTVTVKSTGTLPACIILPTG